MADIELMIKVDEEKYKNAISGKFHTPTFHKAVQNGIPLPKGHWIAYDEEPHEEYECSKCGYAISTYADEEPHEEYKYCPNCGCKMLEP